MILVVGGVVALAGKNLPQRSPSPDWDAAVAVRAVSRTDGTAAPSAQPRGASIITAHDRGAVSGTAQQLVLRVLPGPLTASPTSLHVQIEPRGSGQHFRVVLPAITVVDARGSLVGWTLSLSLIAVDGVPTDAVHARLFADAPTVVYGEQWGLRAGRPGALSATQSGALCSAEAGGGGGTFRCGGHVDVSLHRTHDADVERLSLTLAAVVR